MKLYELSAEYARMVDTVDDEESALALGEVVGELEAKVGNLCLVIATLDAEGEQLRAEEKRLAARRQARENRAESLRDYLRMNMDAMGIAKIKSATHTITIGDGPQRCVVDDESLVPAQFTRTKTEVDKKAVLEAFKVDGECVPGTRVERSRALRIR